MTVTIETITAECTTEGTEPSGKRNSAVSAVEELRAPAGMFFNDNSAKQEILGWNGSENHVWLQWHDYEQLIPGKSYTAPTRVTLQVGARSPKHDIGARGWTKVRYKIEME